MNTGVLNLVNKKKTEGLEDESDDMKYDEFNSFNKN